jgi:hypothetical protein
MTFYPFCGGKDHDIWTTAKSATWQKFSQEGRENSMPAQKWGFLCKFDLFGQSHVVRRQIEKSLSGTGLSL